MADRKAYMSRRQQGDKGKLLVRNLPHRAVAHSLEIFIAEGNVADIFSHLMELTTVTLQPNCMIHIYPYYL